MPLNRWHIGDGPHFWMWNFAHVFGRRLNKIQIFGVEFGADDRFWAKFDKNRQIKICFGENIIFVINLSDFLKNPIEFTTL